MRVETQPIDEGHIHLLPHDKENEECIRPGDEDDKHCGKGGDVRAAEQPGLTSLHTMFVREHNRVVNVLNNLHENWDEDHFFHETRRIIIALMQKITYDEFLPLVLGKETMDEFKLGSWNGYDGYDKKVCSFHGHFVIDRGQMFYLLSYISCLVFAGIGADILPCQNSQ